MTVFRAQDVEAPERFDAWENMCSQAVMPLALRTDEPRSFIGQLGAGELGSAALLNFSFCSHRGIRTPALIRRSDPEVCTVALVVRGCLGIGHDRHEDLVGAGDLVLYDSSQPFYFQPGAGAPGLTELLALQVPRSLLPTSADRLKPLLTMRLSGSGGIGALTAQTLLTVRTQMPRFTATDTGRLSTVLVHLLSTLACHHLDADSALPFGSHAEVVLLAVEDFIARHLGDPQLNPRMVAAAHHISIRYLHHLFERRDTTVAAHIRRLRLENIRNDLADPALGHVPIHTVARRWGFTEQATLSRAFRDVYGTAPRDFRKSACQVRRPAAQEPA